MEYISINTRLSITPRRPLICTLIPDVRVLELRLNGVLLQDLLDVDVGRHEVLLHEGFLALEHGDRSE